MVGIYERTGWLARSLELPDLGPLLGGARACHLQGGAGRLGLQGGVGQILLGKEVGILLPPVRRVMTCSTW